MVAVFAWAVRRKPAKGGDNVVFVWLFSYGSITLVCRHLSQWNVWAIPAGQLVNTLILVVWLKLRRQERLLAFGSCVHLTWKEYLWGSTCLLPSACQLMYFGIQPRPAISILCILLSVVQEEILFRGILLDWLSRFGRTMSIVLAGVVFAAAHLVNQADGAGEVVFLYQTIYAAAAGAALSYLAVSCESLIPCIGIHLMNNLTASDSAVLPEGYLPWFWLCTGIYLACGVGGICFLNIRNNGRKYQ